MARSKLERASSARPCSARDMPRLLYGLGVVRRQGQDAADPLLGVEMLAALNGYGAE
jgi:hypothetical protein